MEGLERLRTKFTVDLHPSKLASAQEGVRAHLSSLLLRYNEDLEGVLLSFRNMRVLTHAAVIHPYFPYVRLEVLADVVLFRPRTGTRLVGTVNKVGHDHLGLLVLGCINVSLPADQVRPEFRPCLQEHCWASSKTGGHRLAVGTKVHFDVAAVRHHGQFISLTGSLQHPSTGAEGFARPQPTPGAKAGKAVGGQQQQQAQAAAQQRQQQAAAAVGKKQKKEKKRKKDSTAAEAEGQQQQQHAAPPAVQQQQPQPVAEQQASKKKGKKNKQKQQAAGGVAEQQNAFGTEPAAAPVAAPAAAAAERGEGKKKQKKDTKRKAAEAAEAPGAPANGSAEQPQKKKKMRKD